MSHAAGIVDWVASSPIINGVLFGCSDWEVEGPPVCAVAVARGFRGFGKGLTQSDALASAVGEALEQYAASQVRHLELYCATFREIEEQAFDPRWLCLYKEEQYRRPGFPYQRFDPDRPMHWVRGQWLDTGESVYMPAFAIWLVSAFEEEALCQVTSNGLAAGSSVKEAAEQAALELYERDAFLNSWIALKPKTRIPLDSFEPPIARIIEHLRSRGAELDVYLVENGSPAFVAVCVGRGNGSDWPAVTLGLGASPQASRFEQGHGLGASSV
jgi:ribosomal protein S12 methylthiotransferase accessory factor